MGICFAFGGTTCIQDNASSMAGSMEWTVMDGRLDVRIILIEAPRSIETDMVSCGPLLCRTWAFSS